MVLEHRDVLPGQTGHEVGRELLEDMYRRHMGKPMPPVEAAPRGKPYFTDGSCHFSVTHTKRHVFCALSDKPVGIDAEELDRDIRLTLAEKILSDSEKRQFDEAQDPRLALLTFWVLKEADAKRTGEGLRGYPEKGNLRLDDPRVMKLYNCLVAVIEEEEYVI